MENIENVAKNFLKKNDKIIDDRDQDIENEIKRLEARVAESISRLGNGDQQRIKSLIEEATRKVRRYIEKQGNALRDDVTMHVKKCISALDEIQDADAQRLKVQALSAHIDSCKKNNAIKTDYIRNYIVDPANHDIDVSLHSEGGSSYLDFNNLDNFNKITQQIVHTASMDQAQLDIKMLMNDFLERLEECVKVSNLKLTSSINEFIAYLLAKVREIENEAPKKDTNVSKGSLGASDIPDDVVKEEITSGAVDASDILDDVGGAASTSGATMDASDILDDVEGVEKIMKEPTAEESELKENSKESVENKYEEEIARLKAELAKEKNLREAAEQKNTELKKFNSGLTSELADRSGENMVLKNINDGLQRNEKNLTESLAETQKQNASLQQENETLTESLAKTQKQNASLKQENETLTESLAETQKQNASLKQENETLTESLTETQKQNASLKQENETLAESLTETQKQNADFQTLHDNAMISIPGLGRIVSDLTTKLEEAEKRATQMELGKTEAEAALKVAESERDAAISRANATAKKARDFLDYVKKLIGELSKNPLHRKTAEKLAGKIEDFGNPGR